MRRRLNREKAILAFALILFSWTFFKWGLFLGRDTRQLSATSARSESIHGGTKSLSDRLPVPPLDRFPLGGDPFGLDTFVPPPPPPFPPPPPPPPPPPDDEEEKEGENNGRVVDNRDGNNGREVEDETEIVVGKRIVIEPLPPVDLPIRLTGTVKAGEDGPDRRALIQDKGTGDVQDARVGDLLPGGYRLDAIRDDSITVVDLRGRPHTLGGRLHKHHD